MSEVIDSKFLSFLGVSCPTELTTVQREAGLFTELISYGWTQEELIIAAKTGYNYAAHRSGASRAFRDEWKPRSNASALRSWLRHHYDQAKARQANLSFDEFVALWCELSEGLLLSGCKRYDYSYNKLRVYIKALRTGLSSQEARSLLRYVFWTNHYASCYLYIALRRKGINRELATQIVETEPTAKMGDLKSIVEAHRRGATDDEILSASAAREVNALALRYRQAARQAS